MEKYEEEAKKTAFERAKAAYGSGAYDDATLEFLFPELKESDDERIRKAIAYAIGQSTHNDGTLIDGILSETALAWLEKKKENIEKEYVFRPLAGTDITIAAEQAIRRAKEGHHLVLAFNGMYVPVSKYNSVKDLVDIYDAYLENQKEQNVFTPEDVVDAYQMGFAKGRNERNPAEWSDGEKEDRIRDIVAAVNNFYDEAEAKELVAFLKQLYYGVEDEYGQEMLAVAYKAILDNIPCGKRTMEINDALAFMRTYTGRAIPQQKREWSEEDAENMKLLEAIFEKWSEGHSGIIMRSRAKEMLTWLKSLRPQPHWKPEGQQLDCLRHMINVSTVDKIDKQFVKDLYEQLKKLM